MRRRWVGAALVVAAGAAGWISGRAAGRVAAAAAAGAVPSSAAAAAQVNPLPATAETVAAGRVLFMRYCAFCHGADGRGGGLPAAGLKPRPTDLGGFAARRWTDAQLFAKIGAGEPGTAMPAWAPILDQAQRWQLVAFIRAEVQRQ